MKKFLIILFFVFGFAGISFAALDLSWIANGKTISSAKLKQNLNYLYDTKADIPPSCSKKLGWSGSSWTCK